MKLSAIWWRSSSTSRTTIPTQAERHHARLEQAFRTIAGQPKIGKNRDDLREDMRCLAVNNYVIYYRHARGAVRILRVLHGARDVQRLFTEE